MGKYTRKELEEALASYNAARDKASETGDWNIWAEIFTEDADYIEHAYGVFKGRDQIRKWVPEGMAPCPHLPFPQARGVLALVPLPLDARFTSLLHDRNTAFVGRARLIAGLVPRCKGGRSGNRGHATREAA